MKLATETINGRAVDLDVDASGRFSAKIEDDTISAKSLDELREQVSITISKLKGKVAIDVTMIDVAPVAGDWQNPSGIKPGVGTIDLVLRGVHPRTNALLLLIKDKKVQLDGYRMRGNVARRLTAEEKERYARLSERLALAQGEMEAFRHDVLIDPVAATGGK